MMKLLGYFRIISFLFRERLKTRSQKLVVFQLSVCVCLKHEYSHKTMLIPIQVTIPVSTLLRLGGLQKGQYNRLVHLTPLSLGVKVHPEPAITFPSPLLELEGREMRAKFTTIVCFKSLNFVPFLKVVYGLHSVYRTCRTLEGDTDCARNDEKRASIDCRA